MKTRSLAPGAYLARSGQGVSLYDADGNVTLTDEEDTYAFPVKSAGYVKLCDDEDLFN